jgi:type I restriction enzyme S subunit
LSRIEGTIRVKRVALKIGSGKTPEGGAEVYVPEGVIFIRSQNVHFDGLRLDDVVFIDAKTDAEMASTRVRPDDVLLNITGASLGRAAIAGSDLGHANVNQHVCIIRPSKGVVPKFLLWCLQSHLVQTQIFELQVGGNRDGLNFEQVGDLALPYFPITTQRSIARYLDRETVGIDVLIAAKRRMVELLEERRRALRDHAFDSEPGWRLKRLLADSLAYGVLVPQFVAAGAGVPMIRTYNLTAKGRVSHEDIAEIPVDLDREYRRTSLRKGDVILSVVGSMGRSAVAGSDEEGFNLNRPLARLQLRTDVPSRLIWHWTQTTHFMDVAKLVTGGGTAQPTLNLGDLANFTVGLPQETSLWPKMLTTLEAECGRLDEIEDGLDLQVGLLQERRQSLITAAVAGQLEIPEAA